MSIFSGKCDFYDWIRDDTSNENTKIYIGDREHELIFHDKKELIPYYPYLVILGAYNDGKSIVVLSSRSFVDEENDDILSFVESRYRNKLRYAKRKYGDNLDIDKLKRDYLRTWSWVEDEVDPAYVEIVDQINNGITHKKIKYPYRRVALMYRRCLREEMINNGLNPEDYGY